MDEPNCLLIALAAFYFNNDIRIYYDSDHVIFSDGNQIYDQHGAFTKDTAKFIPIEDYGLEHIIISFRLPSEIDYLWRQYYNTVTNGS